MNKNKYKNEIVEKMIVNMEIQMEEHNFAMLGKQYKNLMKYKKSLYSESIK